MNLSRFMITIFFDTFTLTEALRAIFSVGKQTSISETELENLTDKSCIIIEIRDFNFKMDPLLKIPQQTYRALRTMFCYFAIRDPNVEHCTGKRPVFS